MNDFNIEKLDKHVDALLDGRVPARDADTFRLGELEDVAKELSLLPRLEFRASLWANLASSVATRPSGASGAQRACENPRPCDQK